MPNKTSAKKALRQTVKRSAKNARVKKNIKTLYKRAFEAIKENKIDTAKELSLAFQKATDKAAKSNILSRNSANRKKSRLMSSINAPVKKEAA